MTPCSPCRPSGQPAEHRRPVTVPTPPRAAVPPPLVGPDDPPPFRVLNPGGAAPVVLVCDHAGRAIPQALDQLGLPDGELERHIAYDIGAAALTEALSARFDAPAVLSGYSRLVIDVNRALEDATAVPVVSDETVIPGNRALDAEGTRRRVEAFFRPYHDAVAAAVAAQRARGRVPAVLSIHSFTPEMHGFRRPWHVGVLWDRDPRIPVPLMARLRADGRWVIGDNEPYSGRNTLGGTVETHATPAGLPNVLLEVRQDLIADAAGVAAWAAILGDALAPILADPDLYRVEFHPRESEA